MKKLSKSQWLLAGVVSGALALGTACKSDKSAEREAPPPEPPTQPAGTVPAEPPANTTPPPGGTGGAGSDIDQSPTQEAEPGTHEGDMSHPQGGSGTQETPDHQGGSYEPGTGGSGEPSDNGVIEEEEDIIIEDGTGGSGVDDTTPPNEGGNTPDEPLPDDTGIDSTQQNRDPTDF
ncbi:hypothetical protein P2318_02265 [Myxococcaceae bacterium GXIMD 01537]